MVLPVWGSNGVNADATVRVGVDHPTVAQVDAHVTDSRRTEPAVNCVHVVGVNEEHQVARVCIIDGHFPAAFPLCPSPFGQYNALLSEAPLDQA